MNADDELKTIVFPAQVPKVLAWVAEHHNHDTCHATAKELRKQIGQARRARADELDRWQAIGARAERLMADTRWRTLRRNQIADALGIAVDEAVPDA